MLAAAESQQCDGAEGLPEPITTKMNRPSTRGLTGYAFSRFCGLMEQATQCQTMSELLASHIYTAFAGRSQHLAQA